MVAKNNLQAIALILILLKSEILPYHIAIFDRFTIEVTAA